MHPSPLSLLLPRSAHIQVGGLRHSPPNPPGPLKRYAGSRTQAVSGRPGCTARTIISGEQSLVSVGRAGWLVVLSLPTRDCCVCVCRDIHDVCCVPRTIPSQNPHNTAGKKPKHPEGNQVTVHDKHPKNKWGSCCSFATGQGGSEEETEHNRQQLHWLAASRGKREKK